jgi:hypothetical protein
VGTLNGNTWSSSVGVMEWAHAQAEEEHGTWMVSGEQEEVQEIDVWCVQETRLKTRSQLKSGKAWATARGLKATFGAAEETGERDVQSSAGVFLC